MCTSALLRAHIADALPRLTLSAASAAASCAWRARVWAVDEEHKSFCRDLTHCLLEFVRDRLSEPEKNGANKLGRMLEIFDTRTSCKWRWRHSAGGAGVGRGAGREAASRAAGIAGGWRAVGAAARRRARSAYFHLSCVRAIVSKNGVSLGWVCLVLLLAL